jgi:hypothetical protein
MLTLLALLMMIAFGKEGKGMELAQASSRAWRMLGDFVLCGCSLVSFALTGGGPNHARSSTK